MTYRDTILQAKKNVENYLYDFKGYFLRDDYDISKMSDKDVEIVKKIDKTFDIINEITTFILKDIKDKENGNR